MLVIPAVGLLEGAARQEARTLDAQLAGFELTRGLARDIRARATIGRTIGLTGSLRPAGTTGVAGVVGRGRHTVARDRTTGERRATAEVRGLVGGEAIAVRRGRGLRTTRSGRGTLARHGAFETADLVATGDVTTGALVLTTTGIAVVVAVVAVACEGERSDTGQGQGEDGDLEALHLKHSFER